MATREEEVVGLMAEEADADDVEMKRLKLNTVAPDEVDADALDGLKLEAGALKVDDEELAAMLARPAKTPSVDSPLSEVEQSVVVIQNAQDYITRMEGSLATLIDAVNKNESILSRLSASWGRMGLVGQISTGAVLTVPAVVAGLVASIPGLVAIGLGGATVYTGAGFLLGDHHAHESATQDRVKDAVLSITQVFSCVIDALAQIAMQLAHQVTRLSGENEKFAKSNAELLERITGLTEQVEKMSAENGQFRQSNTKLAGIVEELGATKIELETKARQAQDAQATLSQLLTQLSIQAAENEGAHGELISKLESMATRRDDNYLAICTRMKEAEKARDDALLKLQTLARQYASLNAQNAATATRLEVAVGRAETLTGEKERVEAPSNAKVLGMLGFLGRTGTETAEAEMKAKVVPPVAGF